MYYSVIIRGRLHSLEPIRSAHAYANASFADGCHVTYEIDEQNPKVLLFTVKQHQTVPANATLREMTEGIMAGEDSNVTWELSFTKSQVRELAVAA